MSEEPVGVEVTRLLPSPASSESENWHSVRGLAGRGLGETEDFGLSSEASAQALGESENLPRPRGCPLALIFARLKQYFRFLLRAPLLVVSDTTNMLSQHISLNASKIHQSFTNFLFMHKATFD